MNQIQGLFHRFAPVLALLSTLGLATPAAAQTRADPSAASSAEAGPMIDPNG
jgi:hypothetical protein